jgi:hypothetical protein
MILFLTSPGYDDTVEAFVRPGANTDVPHCAAMTYGAMLRSNHTVRAVHVFTDLERLSDSELVTAAGLYRALRKAGIPCLNDPARVMGRYQLLCKLFEEGINPFRVYRADGLPKPVQFPVFVRNESDHKGPISGLLKDQDELDNYLKNLITSGRPLRGLLVIEFAAEPEPDGIWRKTGTCRIGNNHAVHNQILSDNWVIKEYGVTSDVLQLEEQAAVIANELPDSVRRALEIAGVEWGRADHALFKQRQIIFEINTNPMIRAIDRGGNAIRMETKRISFARICALLRELDWGDGKVMRYRKGQPWRRFVESRRIRDLLKPVWRKLPKAHRRRLETWISTQNE